MKRVGAFGLLAAIPVVAGLLALAGGCAAPAPPPPELLTTAERSGFRATATHAEVVDLLDEIAERSPIARRATMGRTVEGREIPLLIIADPPVETAEEAREDGRLVAYLQGCIHGGEVCGKEALGMLARQWALSPGRGEARRLLDELIIVIGPVYNADANDRIAEGNRRNQIGPVEGAGERRNAMDLDLNRDHMKLESPEARALASFLDQWKPALTIDTHTTNGSRHQYSLTYAPPLNPAAHDAPVSFVRDGMLPAVTDRLERRTGYKTYLYGNFNRERTVWRTYSHLPRFGTHYRGLRNRMSILSEAHAYIPYKDRVLVTREFVRECLRYLTELADEAHVALTIAEAETVAAGVAMDPEDRVGIRSEVAAFDEPTEILGLAPVLDEQGEETGEWTPRAYEVQELGRFEPTHSVVRPLGYFVPAEWTDVLTNLETHGVRIERLDAPVRVRCEVYGVEEIDRGGNRFLGRSVAVRASPRIETRTWPAGTALVRTAQPLGTLAVYLLEPESDDGLTTAGYFDEALRVGEDFPVARQIEPLRTRR